MTVKLFSNTKCKLGEGPLWHPQRQQLFWFDILAKRLITRLGDKEHYWQFDEHVSEAGWIDRDRLLFASETRLFSFNLATTEQKTVVSLEADNSRTRSNDGRADPWGGFWIGTMSKQAELGLGAIYRYYQGTLQPLYPTISIINASCFSPDYKYGYFTDTAAQTIQRQPLLYNDGWPEGEPKLWLDLTAEDRYPDGSVVDTEGCVWSAQWGSPRIARYTPDGQFLSAISFSTSQISYPAFGAERMQTVFATSATVGLNDHEAQAGQSFVCNTPYVGQQEHRVIL